MKRLAAVVIALALAFGIAAPAWAQQSGTTFTTRIFFDAGPRQFAGSADPEGTQPASPGSIYFRTNGMIYRKSTGTGNTGWVDISGSGVTCSNTNGVAYWTGVTIVCTATPGANVVLAANSGAPFFTSTPTAAQFIATTSVTTPTVTSGSSLTLNPTGDLITDPGGNDILPVTNYDINIGMPTLKYLSLSVGELIAETLVAQDVLATIGGRIIVAPTTPLTADLASGGTTITVKHNEMASGDRIYLQSSPGGTPQVEFMAVTSGPSGSAGAYTYSVTRNLDGTGANDWYAGDAVLNTGTTGDGFIDLYSMSGVLSGSGPSIVGNVRTGTTYNNIEPRWAIGNLNGLYGYGATTYGAAFGVPSAAWVKVDATNGVRLGHNATTHVEITAAGTATFTGIGTGITAINGGNIQTDTITATQIAANAITASEINAGAVTAAKLASGSGTNMIRNSECRVGTADWNFFTSTVLTPTFSFALTPWRLLDESNTCFATVAGTPTAGTGNIIFSNRYPVKAGQVYEGSAYFGTHGGDASTFIQLTFRDISNNILSQPTSNTCTQAFGLGGTELSGYCRAYVIATAPATSASVDIAFFNIFGGGTANPYMFVTRMMLAEGKVNQTEPSEWTPAGLTEIIGGIIKTDTITAANIAANAITTSELDADSVTSAKIVANTIEAADIAAGTITATEIAANTITAGQIAANAIDTSELNAGAVTAGKISVSSLDAISANLGTVTAGLIDGVTIYGGSGNEVVIDSSGVTISSGTGAVNKLKFTSGGTIYDSGGLIFDSVSPFFVNDLFIARDVGVGRDLEVTRFSEFQSFVTVNVLGGSGDVFVCADNTGLLYKSTGACDLSPAPAARSSSAVVAPSIVATAGIERAYAERVADMEKRIAELEKRIAVLLKK